MGIREIENGEFVCIMNGGGECDMSRSRYLMLSQRKGMGDMDTFYARTTQIEFKHSENQ